jgi:hypothetical protein
LLTGAMLRSPVGFGGGSVSTARGEQDFRNSARARLTDPLSPSLQIWLNG